MQQLEGRDPAGHDEHGLVLQSNALRLTRDDQIDVVRFDRGDLTVQEQSDVPALDRSVQPLLVARLDAREVPSAIGQRDLVARLLAQPDGRFDRTVAATDDQDVRVLVRLRVHQVIGDLRQFFARDVQLARCPAAAEGQADVARQVRTLAVVDAVDVIALLLEPLERNPGPDGKLVLLDDLGPDLQQLLLGVRRLREPAVQRQIHGLGHDQLPPRILGHGAAELLLVDRQEVQTLRASFQGARDPGRARADDQQVENGFGTFYGQRAAIRSDLPRDGGPVLDRRADERVAGDLAGQVHARRPDGFERRFERRQVRTFRDVAQRHGDRADRALHRAEPVPDAARAVYDQRLTVDHLEHTLLGAGCHADPATDALGQVHVRELQPRRVTATPLGVRDGMQPSGGLLQVHSTQPQRHHGCAQHAEEDSQADPAHADPWSWTSRRGITILVKKHMPCRGVLRARAARETHAADPERPDLGRRACGVRILDAALPSLRGLLRMLRVRNSGPRSLTFPISSIGLTTLVQDPRRSGFERWSPLRISACGRSRVHGIELSEFGGMDEDTEWRVAHLLDHVGTVHSSRLYDEVRMRRTRESLRPSLSRVRGSILSNFDEAYRGLRSHTSAMQPQALHARRSPRLWFVCAFLALAGCNTVEFYEKGALSDPTMSFSEGPSAAHFMHKTLQSVEGAAGGLGGSAGGGCGCY